VAFPRDVSTTLLYIVIAPSVRSTYLAHREFLGLTQRILG
jgi:hypothetical protein